MDYSLQVFDKRHGLSYNLIDRGTKKEVLDYLKSVNAAYDIESGYYSWHEYEVIKEVRWRYNYEGLVNGHRTDLTGYPI